MSNNKITIPQQLRLTEGGRRGDFNNRRDGVNRQDEGGQFASRDMILLLNQIVRKLNAADALDSGTATASDIVQALQK
jgi:hypothetical protein